MLINFRLAIYEVVLEAGHDGLFLPAYKGSTLRGGFGQVFRRITCSMRQKECRGCLLRYNCPYAYIFETSPHPGSEVLRNYESIPRPFVLEPPLEEKTVYRSGETLTFRLILIGKSIEYLPYFIVVLRELGEIGIGRGRKKYNLREIVAVDPLNDRRACVYREEERLVRNVDFSIRGSAIPHLLEYYGPDAVLSGGGEHPGSHRCKPGNRLSAEAPALKCPTRLTVDFLTMTRIKYEESCTSKVEFHILIRNLLRRLSALLYFHHGEELKLDFSGLIARATKVKLVEDHTHWVDWERFSSRQDIKMKMGGLVGRIIYEGNLSEFFPLLYLGELVHVGKGAVFGMGKYRMEQAGEH
ncbi:CRISPR system precrRNA processing endoribonuclease RAMP protein Cas6 [Desulfofundulus sp.]|uniref:CRISPR system precrRNA processing endoribonuclease RAMP protein Cas6 n=1 Tax=Desulfofundulus sp. TaxID=2282750 RepID=UPI003C753FFA